MNRKHYEVIAEVIREVHEKSIVPSESVKIAANLAAVFMQDNSHFDRNGFYEACGMVHLCSDGHINKLNGQWERAASRTRTQ